MRRRLAFLLMLSSLTGCVVVHPYEREHLAHPSMAMTTDRMEQASLRKMYQSREAAAGGDSLSAGGGCGCGN
jgi:hypothetical protein